MNISIRKNSQEGQVLTQLADLIGIDPADLLAGICINATRRHQRSAQHAGQPAAAPVENTTETAAEPARKPAPSAGLFNI